MVRLFGVVRRRLARFAACQRGAIAIIFAFFAPVALVLLAFAVDQGSLYLERRQLQGVADLAAIQASAKPSTAVAVVQATLRDNGFSDVVPQCSQGPSGSVDRICMMATTGKYKPDPALAVADRFEPSPHGQADAVLVELSKIGRTYFSQLFMAPPRISVAALGSSKAFVAFSVGSRLASLNEGLLNSLLGGLLGTNISLSLMDYNALVDADVDVLEFLDALAVALDLSAATYNDVLGADASVGDIVEALASLDGVGGPAKLALQALGANLLGSGAEVLVNTLVDLGEIGNVALGNPGAGFGATVGVLEMLTAAAALSDGANQVNVGLDLGVPNIASVTLKLAVGEPPQSVAWFVISDKIGAVARTAQTRLQLLVDIGSMNQNLGGGINLLRVQLPIYAEVAYAEAALADISCTNGRPDTVQATIAARPGVADVRIGEVKSGNFNDFSKPLVIGPADIADVRIRITILGIPIVNLPLAKVAASARVESGNVQPTSLVFNRSDIDNGTVKTVSTNAVTGSLVQSLLDDLELDVSLLGLPLDIVGLLLGSLKPALLAILTPLTGILDTVLYNVLSTIGVHIGEADIQVHGATCGRPVLVQ